MCVAPDTCQCSPHWHGHDCGLPVCHQGFFAPYMDPEAPEAPPDDKPLFWKTYRPCYYSDWCNETNGFDCAQLRRPAPPLEVPSGGEWRAVTGWNDRPDRCDIFEVRDDAYTLFQYTREDNSTTPYHRYTPLTPYGWNATGWPWRGYENAAGGGASRTRPWNRASDRQVAFFEQHNVTQGVYALSLIHI